MSRTRRLVVGGLTALGGCLVGAATLSVGYYELRWGCPSKVVSLSRVQAAFAEQEIPLRAVDLHLDVPAGLGSAQIREHRADGSVVRALVCQGRCTQAQVDAFDELVPRSANTWRVAATENGLMVGVTPFRDRATRDRVGQAFEDVLDKPDRCYAD
jgi:hypothetical protein